MTHDEVLWEITRRAWQFGVAVVLAPSATVRCEGLDVSGYFEGGVPQPVLAVAWDAPEDRRLGVLLHEYSHLTQWAENAPVWRPDMDWAPWLDGKPVKNVKAKIEASREVEADCERRTVRLIRELDAPIDLDRYIRSANAYIHFYNVMAAKRKWYAKGRGPYMDPASMAAANPTLDADFSKTPKALWTAIENCL